MAPRAAMLLILVLLLVPSGSGQDDAVPDVPEDALYFMDEVAWREGRHFSTYAPDANATEAVEQFISEFNVSVASWLLEPLPGPWNVSTGSTAWIALSGLDEMLPLPSDDPQESIETAGRLRIDVEVGATTGQALMRGRASFEPETVEPRDEVFTFEIDLDVIGETSVTTTLYVDLRVSGRNKDMTNISPVHLHFGSTEHPSRIQLDGFPYDEYRTWEDDALEEYERLQGILRGNKTPGPTPSDDGDPSTRPTPAPGALVPLLVVLLLVRRLSNARR